MARGRSRLKMVFFTTVALQLFYAVTFGDANKVTLTKTKIFSPFSFDLSMCKTKQDSIQKFEALIEKEKRKHNYFRVTNDSLRYRLEYTTTACQDIKVSDSVSNDTLYLVHHSGGRCEKNMQTYRLEGSVSHFRAHAFVVVLNEFRNSKYLRQIDHFPVSVEAKK